MITHAKYVGPRTYAICEVPEVRYLFQNCTRSNILVRIENESVCICQNTNWLQFWRSNLSFNTRKQQWGKPVKAHLLSCHDGRGVGLLMGQISHDNICSQCSDFTFNSSREPCNRYLFLNIVHIESKTKL